MIGTNNQLLSYYAINLQFLEEKEKELKARTCTEVLGDMNHEKDGGICKVRIAIVTASHFSAA